MKIGFSEKYLSKNGYSLLRPIDLPEAWAAGVTYKRQAIEHDKDLKKIFAYVEHSVQQFYLT